MKDVELQPGHIAAAFGVVIAVLLVVASLREGPMDRFAAAPDFQALEAGPERKAAFFDYLLPIVESGNATLRKQRQQLQAISKKSSPGRRDRRFVEELAADYKLETTTDDGASIPLDELTDELLLRVDEVPPSLALAQAAKESGWGTSRFAREGNNYFGQWCYKAGCGIVPSSRAPGRTHEVEAFDSPAESVESYMRNINTHSGYKSFREARKVQRSETDALSGVALAAELSQYSERRDAYVAELRQLIVGNDLDRLDSDSPNGQ